MNGVHTGQVGTIDEREKAARPVKPAIQAEGIQWERVRLCELRPGDVFERWGMIFVLDGDCGKRGRMVYATLLEPFDLQKYLNAGFSQKEAERMVVAFIGGQPWSRAWEWPDADPEDWDSPEPVICIRKRSTEYRMWVRKYPAER